MAIKKNQAGLYIHVPFCLSKCGYCSFYSIKSISLIPQFLAALEKEIEFYSNDFNSFDTIYIGGGTPSLLTFPQIADIFSAINKTYKISSSAEITIEVNPGDLSAEYLRALHSIGINRLNIGIQSFNDDVLHFLGRRHTAKEAISAIDYARAAGFDNAGIDLIYGINNQDIKIWKKTLQKAVSFSPEHISCYQLSLDKNTPLYKKYEQCGCFLPNENSQFKFFMTTADFLEQSGYIHYEVSNFARSNQLRSRHNLKYWQHMPYLGLGPGAHSYFRQKRWWNLSSVNGYIKKLNQGLLPVNNFEILILEQLQLETLFLGLRTNVGIDLKLFKSKYNTDLLIEKKTIIDKLVENNVLKLKRGYLVPTRAGLAIADSLALI
jgi:oxygen-independent coproporphyrinogen III oxidase